MLIYPEQRDIVLAGVAEGWKLGPAGAVVGETTGQPVLQLDDLIVALRSAQAAAGSPGIACSIDPTPTGLGRYHRLLATSQLTMSRETLVRLEKTLGPSVITVTGVDPDTHFAQVLVAADFLMKRLALKFEASPIADLASYLDLLQQSPEPPPAELLFRLWLAPKYDDLFKAPDGLAWELSGPGVQALTEDSLLTREHRAVDAGKSHRAALQWAASFTENYEAVAKVYPVFAQLRNCIDLAVVAAIVTKHGLVAQAGLDSSLLLDASQVEPGRYRVPKLTPSRASYVQRDASYIVSISGGVDLDSWGVLGRSTERATLAAIRTSGTPPESRHDAPRWWWD